MSSTNRNGKPRAEHDHYITPVEEISKFLTAVTYDLPGILATGFILDPAAGGSHMVEPPYPKALVQEGVGRIRIATMDIREDASAGLTGDYLKTPIADICRDMWIARPKLIITNPPFHLAQEFVMKAFDDVEDGGAVAMLLRLNFFGSQRRKEELWDKRYMPDLTYVHSKRMSFSPDGKTDSIEYMHCVWVKRQTGFGNSTYGPEFTQLRVI